MCIFVCFEYKAMNFFASMKTIRLYILPVVLAALFCCALPASAQENDAQKEKELYDALEKQLDRLTELLDLADWQIFYIDSIMTHDYKAMQDEMAELQMKKVSNTDLYYSVQYSWLDKMYYAVQGVLDEDQWAKYLKTGALKDKKKREKFFEKKK